MWQLLKERLNLTTSYIGCTAIVAQFQNSRPTVGESISVYVARLQAFQLQLQGSTEEITEQALRTHVYTTAPPEFKTAIGYLKRTTGITILNLIMVLKETEEENKVEATIVDSKSGTNLYVRGHACSGCFLRRGGRGGCGG